MDKLWLMIFVFAWLGGFLIGLGSSNALLGPDCPTEDSCAMVREDGQTKLVEVTP